ncbi:hypothetical protein ES703_66642 [subsurface metagenome]
MVGEAADVDDIGAGEPVPDVFDEFFGDEIAPLCEMDMGHAALVELPDGGILELVAVLADFGDQAGEGFLHPLESTDGIS